MNDKQDHENGTMAKNVGLWLMWYRLATSSSLALRIEKVDIKFKY